MTQEIGMRQSGNWIGGREGVCALLAAFVLGWLALAGHAQIRASGMTQAVTNGRSAEEAEKEFNEAGALTKKLTERDLREAVRLYRASVESFLKAGVPQKAAIAEVKAGDTLTMMSRYKQALDAYRQALVLGSGAEEATCAAQTGLAWTTINMGQSTDVIRDADAAVRACAPLKDADVRAYERALQTEGDAQLWSGQGEKSTATLTQSKELAASAEDLDGEALSAVLLAYNVHPNDREAAHQLISSAMELWSRSGNLYGAARGNLAMAYFAGREGNYSAAECEARSALSVFERISDYDNSAVAFNVLGMVGRRSGDLEASAEAYQQARKLFVAAGDKLGEGDAISGLMKVSVDRNDSSHAELYVRGLSLAQSTKNKALLATALIGMGDVRFREHRFGVARAAYEKGLGAAHEAGNPYESALALGRLARLATAENELDEALKLYEQAQMLDDQAGAIEDVAKTQYMRSRIYLMRSEPQKALAEIERTVAIIEQQRLRISKFESRAQYFMWVHEYYALYIRVLMALDRTEPDGKFARRAYEVSERSKVRALLDELANTPHIVNCNGPKPEAAQREIMFSPAKAEAIPPGEPANTETEVPSVERIQAEMKENNAALVEFALGEERSFVWLLDGRSISAFELASGSMDIQRRVQRLRRALEPVESHNSELPEEFLKRRIAQRREVHEQSSRLGELLFGVLPLPTGKRLIIVPDGALQYLPFAALTTSAGALLVDRYEIAMLPSAAALAALRKSTVSRPAPNDEVVVIADPVYEWQGVAPESNRYGRHTLTTKATVPPTELSRALSDLHKTDAIPSLPGSRLEALNIQKILGPSHTRLALGYEASRDAVLQGTFAQARVVHFATHGLLDARQPENSGLVLALFNSQGRAQDGYLRVSDIHGLKLSADLVVLSSCESALGKDMGSEGIIGLPRAFLYAGARRVIASLWKVDDEAAAALMANFYEALKAGDSPTSALSKAERKLRRNPRFRDPYFWGAFFIEGEYR